MELLTGNIKTIYLKYLAASFGSALITSIYGVVDMAVVGQYHGPSGAAAMAVIAPIWNILYSFGLLTGIGGSVLFGNCRGQGRSARECNEYFTMALVLTLFFGGILWGGLIAFEEPLLLLFGADQELLHLSKQYLVPIKLTAPVFLFTQLLGAFLRNDSDPALATKAVLCGGAINLLGDYLLVFPFDLGIMGAGIATAGSSLVSVLVMCTHFSKRSNTLRWVWPQRALAKVRSIVTVGFSTFFIDLAMGLLTTLFNRQIMRYAGADSLAVYGIIVNISTFVQCCSYGIGQAAQPILSIHYGCAKWERIGKLVTYNLITVGVISALWSGLVLASPNTFVRLFMSPTPAVLAIAPPILRVYALSFFLLPLNIYSTYFFQSVMQPMASFLVSVARGVVISGTLIFLLPAALGGDFIWLAMPITELMVALFVLAVMRQTLRRNQSAPHP